MERLGTKVSQSKHKNKTAGLTMRLTTLLFCPSSIFRSHFTLHLFHRKVGFFFLFIWSLPSPVLSEFFNGFSMNFLHHNLNGFPESIFQDSESYYIFKSKTNSLDNRIGNPAIYHEQSSKQRLSELQEICLAFTYLLHYLQCTWPHSSRSVRRCNNLFSLYRYHRKKLTICKTL